MYLKKILSVLFIMILGCRLVLAQDKKTTMDLLEATVWVRDFVSDGRTATTYMQFRNDTIMVRVYSNDKWGEVLSWPFYFYTPGAEDMMWDPIALNYLVFNPARIGKRKSGKYYLYQYNVSWISRSLLGSWEIVKLTEHELRLKTPEAHREFSISISSLNFKAYDGKFPSKY